MEFKIIKSPSKGTIEILASRLGQKDINSLNSSDAIGLVQGRMIDMICAADIAEKSNGVLVSDIRGSCPQNMIMIAIFGDTASVESAVSEIKCKVEKGKMIC
ncbi:BMC domain-containing protein [Proteinivorax hydrogeniformans]|uniref:BMC domain-containing protein n=1 Tax=Proteinivorax hydrogeniformans TaxID=1826727 RepID=A0AAU8HUA8_9FIRM